MFAAAQWLAVHVWGYISTVFQEYWAELQQNTAAIQTLSCHAYAMYIKGH